MGSCTSLAEFAPTELKFCHPSARSRACWTDSVQSWICKILSQNVVLMAMDADVMRWALRLAMRVAALDRILPRLMQSLNTPLRHIILGGQPCYTCLVCKSGGGWVNGATMLPFLNLHKVLMMLTLLEFARLADAVSVLWICTHAGQPMNLRVNIPNLLCAMYSKSSLYMLGFRDSWKSGPE